MTIKQTVPQINSIKGIVANIAAKKKIRARQVRPKRIPPARGDMRAKKARRVAAWMVSGSVRPGAELHPRRCAEGSNQL